MSAAAGMLTAWGLRSHGDEGGDGSGRWRFDLVHFLFVSDGRLYPDFGGDPEKREMKVNWDEMERREMMHKETRKTIHVSQFCAIGSRDGSAVFKSEGESPSHSGWHGRRRQRCKTDKSSRLMKSQ